MKILVCNRGTAATRIMRCCVKLGIPFVTIYSLDDADSLHVDTNSVLLHPSSSLSADTYLNQDRIFEICLEFGITAVHPGFGFLSENYDFAKGCEDRNMNFIGPTPDQISNFGLKHTARALAEAAGVPLLPGTGLLKDLAEAKVEAARIGYPVLLKCVVSVLL
jgi:urea carboxylase